MSGWISRLLGLSGKQPEKPLAAPRQESTRAATTQTPHAGEWQARADVDILFLQWLLSATPSADPNLSANEKSIVDALDKLSRSELAGADLVPRVPTVIPQLLQSMHNENISGAEIAAGIARDAALVAEVIRQSNSSYYKPREPINSLENAVMVLGKNGLRMLIAKAAFRPVIQLQSGRYAKQAAPRLWDQSEKCAQACRVLAKDARIDPFAAFLAGLMHNVGMIVAFRLVDQIMPNVGNLSASDSFCRAFIAHARVLSHRIAGQWNLPEAVLEILAELRGDAPDKQKSPAGAVVAAGDLLSKLRLLVDQGAWQDDDPAADMPENVKRCFDELTVKPEN
jgi:HD-like signal output (HDOD) protein